MAVAVAASPLPQEHQHDHHQHHEAKRAVVTVTNWVTVDGNVQAATTTAESPASVPTTLATSAVAGTSVAGSASSAAASSSSGSSYTGGSSGAAGAKGITYSPYNADGTCKSASEVKSDVSQLSGFDIIRLYGVDCNQVPNVLAAKSSSQKIFQGIFDVSDISGAVSTIKSAVEATDGGWDNIYTISVGNELVNSGSASVSQIGQYVSTAKSALTAAGYSGPIVSVDTFIAVINNPGLCEFSDYMAVNAHAFFDGNVEAPDAGAWVLLQIQRVWSACGGKKDVFITETGWPSRGDANNKCVPSEANQSAAISSIKASAGDSCILFNAFNDLWKANGPFNAEKYWGILN
ncbi:Cell surface mannoprotein mp65 [Scheffersomyces spartinae]|uniref:Cell surface mannoprotein mp65 n=1 Tax=Scheffersomyces spartinae TaxID=45513 RepID=A0A9P7VC10_9ASCO|nr:Cell surface mannoprotein mp65 [Scheffersomyces spartinae]KAG7195020.1 Cell surface mannoprotein mp65 [Scheffersomyces spartinae]